jgi:uncharacterized protein (TIGR02611 family)
MPERGRIMERVREQRDAHRQRGRAYRVGFAVAGMLVVAGGIVLSLPFVPGPGILLIAIGLTMLALEFAWAERLLERIAHRVEDAADASGRTKAAVAALAIAGVTALTVAAVLWDLPLVPV